MPVKIVQIPSTQSGEKQGIDDYLAAGGKLDDLDVVDFNGSWLPPKDWPVLPEEALYGLAGEVVRKIAPETEADSVAILGLLLSIMGNRIGRGAHFVVENDRHYLKINLVLVGESSKGRKGSAQTRVNALFELLEPGWKALGWETGLSSGEGLVHAVRDRVEKEGKDGELVVVDPGVIDKRKVVDEPEFGSPLTVLAREGNTLSAVIRNAWDDVALKTLSKNSKETSTEAHISIVSGTSEEELMRHLTSAKLGGGLANRFLFLNVRRSKALPRGGKTDIFSPQDDLLQELRAAVNFGRESRHIEISEEPEEEYGGRSAMDLWEEVYPELSEGARGLFGAVTSRGEAYVRRLATVYAVLDRCASVRMAHLLAGLSVWEYNRQSCYLLFGDKTGDAMADIILDELVAVSPGGLTKTEVHEIFGRNEKAPRLLAALRNLEKQGRVFSVKEEEPGKTGPKTERWFVNEEK
jgi:hypothetical protein